MGGAAGGALDGPLDAPLTLDAAAFANFALEPPSAAAAGALAPPLFGSHEFTYVGYGGVFDYAPATGTFRMWLVDADAVENRAPLLLPPLSAGTWAPLRRFVYVGHDWWLEYAPATGAYGLRRCEHATWKAGPLRCASLCASRDECGVTSELQVMSRHCHDDHHHHHHDHHHHHHHHLLHRHHLASSFPPPAGRRRPGGVPRLRPPPPPPPRRRRRGTPSSSCAAPAAGVGFDAPLRRGVHKRLAGSNLAYMGDGLLLATNGASGHYAFWLVASAANASGAGAAAAAAAGADGLPPPPRVGRRVARGGARRVVRASDGRPIVAALAARAPRRLGVHDARVRAAPPLDASGAPRGAVSCEERGAGELPRQRPPPGAAIAAAARGTAGGLGGEAPRQLVLLAAAPSAGLRDRQLLDYDSMGGGARILRLSLPSRTPTRRRATRCRCRRSSPARGPTVATASSPSAPIPSSTSLPRRASSGCGSATEPPSSRRRRRPRWAPPASSPPTKRSRRCARSAPMARGRFSRSTRRPCGSGRRPTPSCSSTPRADATRRGASAAPTTSGGRAPPRPRSPAALARSRGASSSTLASRPSSPPPQVRRLRLLLLRPLGAHKGRRRRRRRRGRSNGGGGGARLARQLRARSPTAAAASATTS